ncbi:MAG: hypothetical protein AAGB30_11060 [Pedobacter sp.]|nr:hypothetical protein [Pedobacter sp.]
MMQKLTDRTLLRILHKDYPQVVERISREFKASMPENILTDFDKIPVIIEAFKVVKGLNDTSFNNDMGRRNSMENREIMLAVIAMFYHPQRLANLVMREKGGILEAVSKAISIPKKNLSNSLANAIVRFKVYGKFRNEVIQLYNMISKEYKLLE